MRDRHTPFTRAGQPNAMELTLKFFATFREAVGSKFVDREFDDGVTVREVLGALEADYEGLEDRNVYAKVWRDTNDPPDGEHHYPDFPVGEPLIGKRGRLARVIYMTNVGTIPDSFSCDVITRDGDEWVGQLDEEYLDTLEAGDVFVLGGDHFEFRYRRGSKVYVDRTSARPTVPSWFSERLPMSYDLGLAILSFQRELLERFRDGVDGRPGLVGAKGADLFEAVLGAESATPLDGERLAALTVAEVEDAEGHRIHVVVVVSGVGVVRADDLPADH